MVTVMLQTMDDFVHGLLLHPPSVSLFWLEEVLTHRLALVPANACHRDWHSIGSISLSRPIQFDFEKQNLGCC